MSITFNAEQSRILVRLIIGGAQTTGDLAKRVAMAPNQVSYTLLPLRTAGIVFSTRGIAEQHVTWQLTEHGKAVLLQLGLENVKTTSISKPKPSTYILWCPSSNKAPAVTYPNLDKAKEVQKIMAERYPGQVFHICEVQAGLRAVVSTKLEEV